MMRDIIWNIHYVFVPKLFTRTAVMEAELGPGEYYQVYVVIITVSLRGIKVSLLCPS